MREQELKEDYQEKINELLFHDQKKNKVIQELSETYATYKEKIEILHESRSIFEVVPDEQIIELHTKIEEISEYLQAKVRDIYSLEIQRKHMIELIRMLTICIAKTNALINSPINRKSISKKIPEYENTNNKLTNIIPSSDINILKKSNTEKKNNFYNGCLDKLKLQITVLKKSILTRSEKLVKISEKNFILQEENIKLSKEYKNLQEKIDTLKKDYYAYNITTEKLNNEEPLLK